jgi:hypothetical protein
MTYNLTQLGEQQTFSDILVWTNTQVSDLLGGLFVVSILIVLTLIFSRRMPFVDSLITSSFICFVISALGVYTGIMNFMYPLTFLVITAFGVMYLHFSRN